MDPTKSLTALVPGTEQGCHVRGFCCHFSGGHDDNFHFLSLRPWSISNSVQKNYPPKDGISTKMLGEFSKVCLRRVREKLK